MLRRLAWTKQLLSPDRPSRVRGVALAAVVLGTLLATQGAIVRATGSGLGCPDWPLCHGAFVPPSGDTHALIEYIHRLFATVGGLVILAAAIGAWTLRHQHRSLGLVAAGIVPLLGVQVMLGALAVLMELPPWVVTLHLVTASVLIGLVLAVAILARPRAGSAHDAHASLIWLAGITATMSLVVIAAGGYTSSSLSGSVCPEWPFCKNGEILPAGIEGPKPLAHMVHRALAAVASYAALHLSLSLWRRRHEYPAANRLALSTLALVAANVAIGALNAVMRVPEMVTAAHSLLAQWVWVAALATTLSLLVHGSQEARGAMGTTTAAARARPGSVQFALDLFFMTKPRVVLELLITTIAAMVVAARGFPAATVVVATIGGGALCAGAAATFNGLYDRDIDRLMQRTKLRPIPADRLSVQTGWAWGSALFVGSIAVLGVGVGPVAAGLAATAFAIYVGVYTLGLKRRSPQNIVIGGAAGAIPPVIGWVAGAGTLDWSALVLFTIVFLWTPPHFWALAWVRRADYQRAGVPMLPVVRGETSVGRHILAYSVVLVASTLVLAPVNQMSWVYALVATVLGGIFLQRAWQLWRERTTPAAHRLFKYSITYLTVLFAAMALDVAIAGVI